MQRLLNSDAEDQKTPRFIDLNFDGASGRRPLVQPFGPSTGEQRKTPRRRVLLSALVINQNFGGLFRCSVHDVSDNGARLKIPNGSLLPAAFWLVATSSGLAFDARTIWRLYPNVGVSVSEPIDLREPADSIARQLRSLWMAVTT